MPATEGAATRALACLYSTPAQRALLEALCGIEREIGASLGRGLDHQVAHTRLAWWREECGRCADGSAVHPLTRALCAALGADGAASLRGLSGLVDVATWDLAGATFETRRELAAYCERWAAGMIAPLAAQAAPALPAAAWRGLGAALRELELLAALERDARAGRVRLPLDELARAGVGTADLARPPWDPPLAALVRARHLELRAALAAAVRAVAPGAQAALRGLMVWAAIASVRSRRTERRLPSAPAAGDHHAPLDGLRAWRAARRAAAGRLAL
jgi:15-cis-phytoene synthase